MKYLTTILFVAITIALSAQVTTIHKYQIATWYGLWERTVDAELADSIFRIHNLEKRCQKLIYNGNTYLLPGDSEFTIWASTIDVPTTGGQWKADYLIATAGEYVTKSEISALIYVYGLPTKESPRSEHWPEWFSHLRIGQALYGIVLDLSLYQSKL